MQRLRVIVLPLLLGVCASLFTLVANMPTAEACSMMPPQLDVSPTSDLQPGDWFKVQGYGFVDVIMVPIVDEYDPETGELIPPHSCMGLEFVPQEVTISWIGSIEEPLTRVKGPEFAVELQVPAWAEPGWAAVQADWVVVEVQVATTGPEPCPLFADGRSANTDAWPNHCPRPCDDVIPANGQGFFPECPHPCDYVADQPIRPACPEPCLGGPAVDVWCPEPCPVYLADEAVSQVYPPKCPEPCLGGPAVDVWCPEPCPVYLADEAGLQVLPPECPEPCLGGPAIDIWCPEPCLDYPAADVGCPEPCLHILGFEGNHPPVWPDCPPDPCAWIPDNALVPEQDLRSNMPCPDPCAFDAPTADVTWNCPWPCLSDGDHQVCPVPLPEPQPEPQPWPEPQPIPAPVPETCVVGPNGHERCVVPAGVRGESASADDDGTVQSPPAPGEAPIPISAGTTIAAPLPPAPRIDFDGCRGEGTDTCVSVLHERSIDAIRSVVTALFDW